VDKTIGELTAHTVLVLSEPRDMPWASESRTSLTRTGTRSMFADRSAAPSPARHRAPAEGAAPIAAGSTKSPKVRLDVGDTPREDWRAQDVQQRERNRKPIPSRNDMIVVEDSAGLIGFAHTVFDEDSAWGALLDNLHVAHGRKRRGIGSQLLATTAAAVIEWRTGLYLWVQEQNVAAQAFYDARGGKCVDRALISPPGGVASRLNGSPAKLRYAWSVEQLARLYADHPETVDLSRRNPARSGIGLRTTAAAGFSTGPGARLGLGACSVPA